MKYVLIVFTFIVVLYACGCSSCTTMSRDEGKIEQAYQALQESYEKGDSETMLSLLSEEYTSYYLKIMYAIKNLDSAELIKLPLDEVVTILSYRQMIDRKELLGYDSGEDLLKYSIENKRNTKLSFIKNDYRELTMLKSKKVAKARIQKLNSFIDVDVVFYRRGDSWKIDLSDVHEKYRSSLYHMYKNSGMSKERFIHSLLETTSKSTLKPTLWNKIS